MLAAKCTRSISLTASGGAYPPPSSAARRGPDGNPFAPMRYLAVLRPYLISLAFVLLTTLVLVELVYLVELDHVGIVYVVPVLASAFFWGVGPAIVSAVAGVAATAYFFYAPLFSLGVYSWQQILDLILFVIVALVTSNLAARARTSLLAAKRNETETAALYAFARELAVATNPDAIYAAIQSYMSDVLRYRAIVFDTTREGLEAQFERTEMPAPVREAVRNLSETKSAYELPTEDPATHSKWLVRALSPKTQTLGFLAVEIGTVSEEELQVAQMRVEGAIKDATATLERLDVQRIIGDTKTRSEAEDFREALIESVSHELRTPLASIMGATSVLSTVPSVLDDPRLAALSEVVRDEVERLNTDIQNLLDASRITRQGVRARRQWVEALDIVNAVIERQQRRLSAHEIAVDIPPELPLLRVDPGLIEQVLGQIVDNAAKYSEAGTAIRIVASASQEKREVSLSIIDQGAGLTDEEKEQIWDRFYRAPRLRSKEGSGLGLWIARAFASASGGRLSVQSEGAGKGTTVTLTLPAPWPDAADRMDDLDG